MKKLLFRLLSAVMVLGFMVPIGVPVAAEGDGSISGYVYESGGTNGILGADVRAYIAAPGPIPLWSTPNGQAITDINGHYSIANLAAGNYRVVAVATNHERIIYDGKHLLGEGTTVSVEVDQTSGPINFSLGPGGSISGKVKPGL